MDLGTKSKNDTAVPAAPNQPSVHYPSFSLRDEKAEEFLDDHPEMDVDDEIIVTMRLRMSGISKQNYDNSVGFECLTMETEDESGTGKSKEPEPDKNPKRRTGSYNNPAVENLIDSEEKS